LKIKHAKVTSKDGNATAKVTETMDRLKRRGNSLFILDFQKDLELPFSEGTLKFDAKFDDDEWVGHVLPFDDNTEFLLCDV